MIRAPARPMEQHLSAARWYADAGDVPLALEHLLLAGETRSALRLLAAHHAELYDHGGEAFVLRALGAIPERTATADFESMLEFASCHALISRERFLELVAQTTWWAERSVLNGTLRARLAVLQSLAASLKGDWVESGALARQALRELGDGWRYERLVHFSWNLVAREEAFAERWGEKNDEVREAEMALSPFTERRLALEGTRALGEALSGRPAGRSAGGGRCPPCGRDGQPDHSSSRAGHR